MKYKDIERFFNEWKITFERDGPFTSEQDLGNLETAMTDPDDFMVGTLLKSFIEISQWCVGEKSVNFHLLRKINESKLFYVQNNIRTFMRFISQQPNHFVKKYFGSRVTYFHKYERMPFKQTRSYKPLTV